jgi:hypothetical protein
MNTVADGQRLIDEFLARCRGRSGYLESRMRIVRQAVADADANLKNGETEFALTNLAIARHTVGTAIEAFSPFNSEIGSLLMELFTAVDDAITTTVQPAAGEN